MKMKFQYTYRTTALELWKLSMYYTYGSMVGVCNIIFTFAVLALMVSRWDESGTGFRALLLFGVCLFTVIQPLAVYIRAKKQTAGITQDTTVSFNDEGIHIKVGGQFSNIKWAAVRKISRKPTMMIIFSDSTHGFLLTDRVLGEEKEAFYRYVVSKIEK